MTRSTLIERLLRFGLSVDRWELRSTKTGALVAFVSPPDAEALVERLEHGLSLEHALRAVRAVSFRRAS